MSSSELVQPHHLARKAVVYVRQSTIQQVRTNLESQLLQRDMRERAIQLGWPAERVEVVDADTGHTAATTAGRDEYKSILSQVALGHVGIVISYESARLARNCSDWYPLLDLCTARRCLIADRDGVYDPGTANGRQLLGMKGFFSEIELHMLRGRLLAGLDRKARRGELALRLPVGLEREPETGRVFKDPNQEVQGTVELVFKTFLEHRSACRVVRVFREQGIAVPRRQYDNQIAWRPPTIASIISFLANPTYAGAFVYGRRRLIREAAPDGHLKVKQQRRPIEEWRVIIKDRYPSYIDWKTFEDIQTILRDNFAEYDRNRTRGVPREGAALLHGITHCGRCGHQMVVAYKGGTRYICNYLRQKNQAPVCQNLPADAIDQHVVGAFFEALAPAELNIYEAAMSRRQGQQDHLDAARKRELERLRYEVDLARRQFNRVDPDNRLVASELERRWEAALRELREAEERHEREVEQRAKVVPISISRDYRAAFESLGKSLPELWRKPGALSRQQRKSLLRCLIDKVVIQRDQQRDQVATRIVWRGGVVSETMLSVPVLKLEDTKGYAEMEKRIAELAREGRSDQDISKILNENGFRSAHSTGVLPSTVRYIRQKLGLPCRYHAARTGSLAGHITLPRLAEAAGVTVPWMYDQIRKGVISIAKDAATALYLFPDSPRTVLDIRRLRAGKVHTLRY